MQLALLSTVWLGLHPAARALIEAVCADETVPPLVASHDGSWRLTCLAWNYREDPERAIAKTMSIAEDYTRGFAWVSLATLELKRNPELATRLMLSALEIAHAQPKWILLHRKITALIGFFEEPWRGQLLAAIRTLGPEPELELAKFLTLEDVKARLESVASALERYRTDSQFQRRLGSAFAALDPDDAYRFAISHHEPALNGLLSGISHALLYTRPDRALELAKLSDPNESLHVFNSMLHSVDVLERTGHQFRAAEFYYLLNEAYPLRPAWRGSKSYTVADFLATPSRETLMGLQREYYARYQDRDELRRFLKEAVVVVETLPEEELEDSGCIRLPEKLRRPTWSFLARAAAELGDIPAMWKLLSRVKDETKRRELQLDLAARIDPHPSRGFFECVGTFRDVDVFRSDAEDRSE